MIISTSGFGNTGASAVLDFLRGYPDIQVLDGIEFQLLHMPDGLLDLKQSLVYSKDRLSSNAAIKRFLRLNKSVVAKRLISKGCDYPALAEEYIQSLAPISWQGNSVYDPDDIVKHKMNVLKRGVFHLARKVNPNFHPKFEERYFIMMDEEDFNIRTKEFVRKILDSLKVDKNKDTVLDMLVSAVDPCAGLEFLDETKIIVVYRDPVDLFIRATTHQATNGFFPCTNVDQFITYYRSLMENTVIGENVLCIQYEDLIYQYYPTTERIMNFLGYTCRPDNEFKYFNPDISVKYTNTRPTHNDNVAIETIDKYLREYIYSFVDYIPVNQQKKLYEGVRQ